MNRPPALPGVTLTCLRLLKDLPVGDVNHATRALFRIDPIAYLHQSELEDTQIDHVSAIGSDLHTITDVEGPAPHDEEEPSEVDDRIAQGNPRPAVKSPRNVETEAKP